MILTTPRLTLRPWDTRDIDVLPGIANDRSIWLNVRDGFPHPYDRASAEAWVALCAKGTMPHSFAIDANGSAIGGIGLHPLDDVHRKTAELGYWLGIAHWGRGFATEAVRAIVEYGFSQLPLERIQAGVYDWNEASSRVLLKANFQFEGRMRRHAFKDTKLVDMLLYARIRS
ncbi:MAG TPA: GNAT family N-acetyltransferase [Polyangium sp.]|nr:GNAT family N-acetyltransferase [Polyangium sp.]